MTEPAEHKRIRQEEELLIDFLTGQTDPKAADVLRARIEKEPELQKRRDDLANAFAALDLLPAASAPDDLVEKTLTRIAGVQQTNALLAMQELGPRRGLWSAFRLREIAAIAAILLVMAGVLIPSLHVARQRSQQGLCAAQMGQIGSALQTHAINHDGLLPAVNHPGAHWLKQGDSSPESNSAALFKLLKNHNMTNPTVFQCPAVGGPSFVMNDTLDDFPKAEHINYSYQHALHAPKMSVLSPEFTKIAEQMVILADQTPLFDGGRFHAERMSNCRSRNHGGRGQNVLYLDGHTAWSETPDVGVAQDNIYLVQNVTEYDGDEIPATLTDTFLLPAYTAR